MTVNDQRIQKYYQIGTFCFSVLYPEDFIIPENFAKFKTDSTGSDYEYEIDYIDEIREVRGTVLAHRPDILVLTENNLEKRVIGVKGRPLPYALYEEVDEHSAHISFVKEQMKDLSIDPVFTSLFALERHLIKQKAMVLHSAFIRYKDTAVLFSAPSETGKSTQAGLWEKYKGAVTINGDRSLLQKMNDIWMARGWPVCGSSEICNNLDVPVRSIVMLSQSRDGRNHLERLKPAQAFRMIYGQITINGWNKAFADEAFALLESLITEVPIYHLTCTISEDAVNMLEKELYNESERNSL